MRKKYLFLLIVIVMGLVMSSCNKVDFNSGITNSAVQQLETKYNCTFEATHVGNRLNYSTGTVFLIDDEGIMFSATVDSKTKEVEDDYIRRIISEKYESIIKHELERNEIDAGVYAFISCDDCSLETNRKISLDSFKEEYKLDSIVVYLCLNNNTYDYSRLFDAFEKLNLELNVKISVFAYSLGETKFQECKLNISKTLDINTTWFDEYDPENTIVFSIENGLFAPDRNSIVRAIEGK